MKQDLKKFWKNKKVLITGHTGFKGSWLTVFLYFLGAELYGISREEKDGIYKLASISDLCKKEFFLDISDNNLKKLEEIVFSVKPDIVFHFAAQSLVIRGYEDPRDTVNSNINGTFNILDSINTCTTVKTLIIATTDKVYKYPEQNNSENSELGGKDFYSATKVSAELIIQSFINSPKRKDLSITVVRSGNVIGGGDRAENRLITDLVKSLLESKNFTLRMPKSVRPWQFILDSLFGYIKIAENSYEHNESEIFNLNSELNNNYDVEMIAEIMVKKWSPKEDAILILKADSTEHKEVDVLRINSKKARKKLNWSAKYNIEKTVDEIINWEKNYEHDSGPDYSISQVAEYLNY